MGCSFMRRCGSSPYAAADSAPNPEPDNFLILNETTKNGFLILSVLYPTCTNFEGRKLLVYEGFKSSKQLLAATNGRLDPHFSDSEISPIARFSPTQRSLDLIDKLVR